MKRALIISQYAIDDIIGFNFIKSIQFLYNCYSRNSCPSDPNNFAWLLQITPPNIFLSFSNKLYTD